MKRDNHWNNQQNEYLQLESEVSNNLELYLWFKCIYDYKIWTKDSIVQYSNYWVTFQKNQSTKKFGNRERENIYKSFGFQNE
jgi:hypothetical protein